MDKTAFELQQRILALIARGVDHPTTDEEFDQLARELFAFQHQRCAPYRAYCDRLKLTPHTVTHWKQIPAVPTSAFKRFALTCFPIAEAVAEFHTSGTTQETAGKHYLRTLELYEAAIQPNFAAHVLGDGGGQRSAVGGRPDVCRRDAPFTPKADGRDARSTENDGGRDARSTGQTGETPVLRAGGRDARPTTGLAIMVLTASPQEAPHSSLSHMMGVVIREFGAGRGQVYVKDGVLRVEELIRDLRDAQAQRQPVLLLGTAFAFVHLLDYLARHGLRFEMADGSRVMETGGFKGRSRQMPKAELYGLIERLLGVPKRRIVNEYGMTELSTQFYDDSLRINQQTDCKTVPPWARVVVIDPNTGREAAKNGPGLIRVFDLANLWSMMCVQTEDLGMRAVQTNRRDACSTGGRDARPTTADAFEVLGRAAGAEVRGCSLTAEELQAK